MTAHDDLRRDATALLAFLDRLTTEVPALISRAQIPTGRDGFPRTASGADRSSPGSTAEMPQVACKQGEAGLWYWECSCGRRSPRVYEHVTDAGSWGERHRDDHATSALDYSDPTGDAAVARPEPDPAKARLRAVRRNLDDILRRAQNIQNILDAEKVDRDKATPAGDEDRWCQSCARDHGYREPIWAGRYAKYCRWCGEFFTANRIEPPLTLLERKHRGEKIYDRDVVAALRSGRKAG